MVVFTGLIEGFYGRPWPQPSRLALGSRLSSLGLNCYMYAPKDDAKHRTLWRSLYDEQELSVLRELTASLDSNGVKFIYAIAPGLDMTYSSDEDLELLRAKIAQVTGKLPCAAIALLVDDIPAKLCDQDKTFFASDGGSDLAAFGRAHAHVATRLRSQVAADVELWLCPTHYCTMMCEPAVQGAINAEPGKLPAHCDGYLPALGAGLPEDVALMWTGPTIVSEHITVPHILAVSRITTPDTQGHAPRRVIVWDNLYANDYALGARLYLGPYNRGELFHDADAEGIFGGLVLNPCCEYELIDMPLLTLSAAKSSPGDPESQHAECVRVWSESLCMGDGSDAALLCDAMWLPHSQGPRSSAIVTALAGFTGRGAPTATPTQLAAMAAEFVSLYERLTRLPSRALLYALHPYIWAVKEECIIVEGIAKWLAENPRRSLMRGPGYADPFYVPGTYNGGFVSGIRSLVSLSPTDAQFRALPLSEGPFVIRPMRASESESLLRICLGTGDSGNDATHLYPVACGDQENGQETEESGEENGVCDGDKSNKGTGVKSRAVAGDDSNGNEGQRVHRSLVDNPDVLGLRWALPYALLDPKGSVCLVIEDASASQPIVGYALAALDSASFYAAYEEKWRPYVRERLGLPADGSRDPDTRALGDKRTPTQMVLDDIFHVDILKEYTDRLANCSDWTGPPLASVPSHLHIDILGPYHSRGLGTRLMHALLDTLRSMSSPGVHLEMSSKNAKAESFYKKLGFEQMFRDDDADELLMGLRL